MGISELLSTFHQVYKSDDNIGIANMIFYKYVRNTFEAFLWKLRSKTHIYWFDLKNIGKGQTWHLENGNVWFPLYAHILNSFPWYIDIF